MNTTPNPKMPYDDKIQCENPYYKLWGWEVLVALVLLILFFFNQQPPKPLPSISHILVEKSQHKMTIYHDNQPIKEYRVALGFQPTGPKETQGDGKTPEGIYKIIAKNKRSRFHLALKISYPNAQDVKMASAKNAPLGNNIMIHGLATGLGWIGKLHTLKDWTRGCIAVTNPEIEEIYAATSIGTSVEIRP